MRNRHSDVEEYTNRTEQGVYDQYYRIVEYNVIDNIKNKCRGIERIAVYTVFNLHIDSLLKRISLLSFILEMNLCHQFSELSGETDTELYQNFVEECLGKEQWLTAFYAESPLLNRYMRRVMKNTEKNVVELIRRFQTDMDLLNRELYARNPCTLITKIDSTDSDTHRGGQRVYILKLDNGEKLVYKPRNLAIDVIFRDTVKWAAKGVGIDYEWNRIIDRGDYGWCEWVDNLTCENEKKLERYYMRNGLLLAVSYLLGSSDFHYENLIAHGEYPIIIDLEMGIGRRAGTMNRTGDPAQELYCESVLRTGLLPMFAWDENGEGVNAGAINASGGDLVPIKVPVIAQPGTINMHIEYAQPKMKPAKNLATLNHHFVEPYQYRENIKKGFELAYQFIMEHKADVLKKVQDWKSVPVRFLANHTQLYSMLLSTSYLPNYMRDEGARRQVLSLIRKREGDPDSGEWIHKQEVEEMVGGDIPYFWYQVGGTALYSGTGECYPDFFIGSAETELLRRLKRMSTENMEQQKRLIDSTLLIGERGKRTADSECGSDAKTADRDTTGCKKQEALCESRLGVKTAEAVGDLLLKEAVWDEHRENVNWIGMMLAGFRERGYLIRPMGPYLYDGWAGVALFMVRLARESKKRKFTEVAEKLKRKLFQHTDQLIGSSDLEKRSTGAYTGEASIAYAYQLLYEQEQDGQYLTYMEKQCAVLPRICQHDCNYDVLGGNTGAVLVLLNAYDMTGKEKYIRWAMEAGDHLIASATKYEWGGWGWITPSIGKALTGFAHGASGIMYALARLSDYSGERKYEEAAYRAFLFEQHHYRKEKNDWTDLRFTDEQEKQLKYDTAWCHGWGGILMAGKIAKRYVSGEWGEELERVSAKVQPKYRYQRDESSYSLCHGKLGNVALLYSMGEEELAGQRYQEIICELGGYVTNIQNKVGQQECENFGLLSGISGIGYTCLCDVEEVVKILTCGV